MTNQVAVRDANVPIAEGQNFFQSLRALGLSSFELSVNFAGDAAAISHGETFNVMNDAGLQSLKSRLADEGVNIVALLLATDFSASDAQMHTDATIRLAGIARELGAPAIRLDPMTANHELSAGQVRENTARHVSEILRQTQGVDFGLENHGIVGNSRDFLEGVFADVGDPRLGMTLDTANFYWSGMPLSEVYETLEHLAPRTKHTHIKNINYPQAGREVRREPDSGYAQHCCPLDEGDIELKRVVHILRSAGYTGALCIENESLPRYSFVEQVAIIQRDAAALRAASED